MPGNAIFGRAFGLHVDLVYALKNVAARALQKEEQTAPAAETWHERLVQFVPQIGFDGKHIADQPIGIEQTNADVLVIRNHGDSSPVGAQFSGQGGDLRT